MVTQKGTIKRRNKRSRDKSNTGIVSSLFSSGFVCGSAVRDLPPPLRCEGGKRLHRREASDRGRRSERIVMGGMVVPDCKKPGEGLQHDTPPSSIRENSVLQQSSVLH